MNARYPLFALAALSAAVHNAWAQDAAAPMLLPEVTVTSGQLDANRNGIQTQTGSSTYHIDQYDIEQMPLGSNTSFNQVLLQAPGVAQDSYGQLHVRGDHGDLQYRINGIIIPESIGGFGQSLDPRFFSEVSLLTGALPAQYGYRTAGVVDIQTKSGVIAPGGTISLMGGSYGTLNPSIEYGGTSGRLDYYVTAQFMRNELGIESPTAGRDVLHDTTRQEKAFGYLSYLLDNQSRATFMFGSSLGHFQIPNNPGQSPVFPLDGVAYFPDRPSAGLDETQREVNHYGILAYQGKLGVATDYQVAYSTRYTQVLFYPDAIGDLMYNGIASSVVRSNFSNGLQGDASYKLNDSHTVRYGAYASVEHAISGNTSSVFLTDADGAQLPGGPVQIADNSAKNGTLLGLYLQDEWKLSPALVLNYGLRADRVAAYVDEGQISPRAGLVYTLSPDTTVHLSYARYFTPPPTELVSDTDIARFQNTTNAPEVTRNDPVKSERSHYLDIGISSMVLPGWTVGLDGYYKYVRDLLDEGQFGAALVFSPFNYNRGRVYGLELTNGYRNGDFSAYLNLALSRAVASDIVSAQYNFGQDELDYIATHDVHLDHDQRLSGSGGVAYTWKGTMLSLDGVYGSGLRAGFANTSHLPSYVAVNLAASHDFIFRDTGKITARVALINAFDKVYEIRDGSGIGVGAPQFGARRALYATLSKDF